MKRPRLTPLQIERYDALLTHRLFPESPTRTLSQIAAEWGVTRERVRSIESGLIRRLRNRGDPLIGAAPAPKERDVRRALTAQLRRLDDQNIPDDLQAPPRAAVVVLEVAGQIIGPLDPARAFAAAREILVPASRNS